MTIIASLITIAMVWRWRSRTLLILMLIAVAVAGSLTMTTVGKAVVGRRSWNGPAPTHRIGTAV